MSPRAALASVVLLLVACTGPPPSPSELAATATALPTEPPESTSNGDLVGEFLDFVGADLTSGIAYFTITNNGDAAATATCSISVWDGEASVRQVSSANMDARVIKPGESVEAEVLVSLNPELITAPHVNAGEITDC